MSAQNDSNSSPVSMMEQKELLTIRDLESKGYKNPLKNSDHNKFFHPTAPNGKKYRIFMASFIEKKFEELTANQIRKNEYEVDHCNDQLLPLLQRDGKINYPIIIDEQSNVDHGHHRRQVSQQLWPKRKIPCIVRSSLYEVLEDGGYKLVDCEKTVAFLINSAKTNPNTPNDNLVYTMEDVVNQALKAFDLDNKVCGLNPSGKKGDFFGSNEPEDPFTKWMSWQHPRQFRTKGIRTKIRKSAASASGHSVIIPKTPEGISNAALKVGWSVGVKRNKKSGKLTLLPWLEWQHEGRVVVSIGTDGNKLQEKVRSKVMDHFLDGTTPEWEGGIKLVVYIGGQNIPQSIALLNKTRKSYLDDEVVKENIRMVKNEIDYGIVEEVVFMKQLTDFADKGLHYKWDFEEKQFVEQT